MSLRTILLISAATAGVCACSPRFFHRHGAMKAVTTLDCPTTQGDLTRQSAAADGRSCVYSAPDGGQVTLQLIALNGASADAALAPLEASLRTEVPTASSGDNGGGPGQGRVDIDLPGIHIHASGHDADTGDGQVKIIGGHGAGAGNVTVGDGSGGVQIEAKRQGAEVRINDARGGIRRDFILATDTAGPHGYKVAGYEARGPEGGPVVVASMLAKSDDHEALSHDVRRLIRLNVG